MARQKQKTMLLDEAIERAKAGIQDKQLLDLWLALAENARGKRGRWFTVPGDKLVLPNIEGAVKSLSKSLTALERLGYLRLGDTIAFSSKASFPKFKYMLGVQATEGRTTYSVPGGSRLTENESRLKEAAEARYNFICIDVQGL